MKIGIDTHFITCSTATGNRTYTAELVRALIQLDRENDYFLYATGDHPYYNQLTDYPNVHLRRGLSTHGVIRNFFSLPFVTSRDDLDILHLQFILPWMIKVPTLLAIHDLYYSHAIAPSIYEQVLSKLTIASAQRADHIATLSEYSKIDIIKRCRIPAKRITVIPLAAHKRFSPSYDLFRLEELKMKYGIERDFILFVGRTDDPRKNVSQLIDAYIALYQTQQIHEQLVIVGRHGPMTAEHIDKIQSISREKDVLFPGIVAENDLPILLAGAKVFIYVSSFEGFGLPVLEAMACGVPVITSNTTSLPEVAGDATIQVTPGNLDELTTSMTRVLQDKSLQHHLRKAGIEQAKLFSWERSAKLTHNIYSDLANLG